MRSSINYDKPHREADLFAKSEQRFGCFYPSRSSALSESPGEEKSISQSGLSSQSTVSSVKTENWVDNSDHLCFQSCAEAFPASADKLALLASVASHSAVDLQSTLKGVSENIDQATMATYLTGSNAQADAMQTLYLMNPGYAGYGESPNPGNMVLLSPTAAMGQGSPLGNHGQQHQQQPFVGFSVPSTITQSPLSHQPPASNTSIGLQNSSPNLFTGRLTSQGFNWGGGNELSFIPSSGVMEDGQQLAGGLNSVGPGQQSSDMSHYGLGSLPQASFQEQAPLMPNGMGLGLNMGNMQSPTTAAAGQILSLSLSPQQSTMMPMQSFSIQPGGAGVNHGPGYTSAAVENNFTKADAFSNGLNMFRASYRENTVGTGFQNQVSGPGTDRQASIIMSYSTGGGYGSKYLKAAQELLSEVVSVGKTTKSNTQQHTKLQSWMGPNSGSDVSFSKDSNYMEFTGKEGDSVVGWRSVKDGEVSVTAVPTSTASIPEHNAEAVVDLTPAERQELQTKKAKLMAMRDEVDRRYKQYYHQMQIVVASFESAAGLGAAKTYTALPLQTISKHFRCLRDAITGQIRAASRALGEEEVKGETSRLRFVDQHLQQQRALRQLGMMQQHAWRPQRGLPERSVSILRAWLFEHFLHPYPKDADKVLLARQTGLSRNQVSNWFINARVRLWKPMVEEMYLEEIKEGESEGADKADRDEGDMVGGDASSEGTKPLKQPKLSNTNNEGYQEQNNGSDQASDVLQGRQLLGSPPDGFLFHDKENTKKIRNGVHDSSSLLSPNAMTVMDFKPNEAHGEDLLDHDIKIRSEDRHREHYGIVHSGFVQADNESLAGYVPFQVGGLNRYSQESLAAGYAANSAVSLTLGLQHCEGLSLSRAQQQYGQGHMQLAPGRVHEDGGGPTEYYSTNESSYDVINLQNRKPFPSHLVHHDFVA